MRYWEECCSPDKEKFLAVPIWVRLFGLPMDFWDPEILEGIGNTIGSFVKIAESTKKGRYTSCARICVYMNIANPIPEAVELEYHEEVWQQALDYEHIPFRCRKCHEYGHLYKECPLKAEEEERKTKQQRKNTEDNEGFQEIKNRKRSVKETPKEARKEQLAKAKEGNLFEILQVEEEDEET